MFKRIFAVAAAASLGVLGATAAAQAQAQSQARPAGHLHGVRVINLHRAFAAQLSHTKVSKISGVVYARGHRPKAAARAAASCTEPQCPVTWQGGLVQHTPHVYLLLWGPNWGTDPNQEATATYLQKFFSGLGVAPNDNWSTITSQYADTSGAPVFPGAVFEGVFNDTSTPPSNTSVDQIGAEADGFATSQNITDLNDAQIVVATQSGTCPQGFVASACTGGRLPHVDCGYHSFSNPTFINLPYLLDAGANCAEDFVNPAPGGNDDGFSIIGGALYADTITDPFGDSWFDTATGGEVGDQCAGIPAGSPGGAFNLTLSTGTFAMEDLFSNAAGGCVPTGAVKDTIKITSPGAQTNTVGDHVNLAIAGSSTAGNPLTWGATGLPAGLTIGATTGTVTGTPTTAGANGVTVSATDEAGAKKSVSFNWTIKAAPAAAITGDHGKCLDDFGSGTAPGTKVDIWTCNNTPAQKWTFVNGQLSVLGNCLDDFSQGGGGAKLVIEPCSTTTPPKSSQVWTHKSNGEYVLQLNGLCLTDPSGSATNGTQVEARACNNFADQHWSLP